MIHPDQAEPVEIEPPEIPAASSLPPAPPPVEPGALNASLTAVQGIGPRTAQTLERLGLYTLRDMLYFFPRRYDDYTQLKPINRLAYGEEVTVIGTVQSVNLRSMHGGKLQRVEAIVSDGTGSLRVTWFNQVWIAQRLNPGAQISLSGKVSQYLGRAGDGQPLLGAAGAGAAQHQSHCARLSSIPPRSPSAGCVAWSTRWSLTGRRAFPIHLPAQLAPLSRNR